MDSKGNTMGAAVGTNAAEVEGAERLESGRDAKSAIGKLPPVRIEDSSRRAVLKQMETLERNIETTRCNRISAANRLISHERFVQAINIYYSCFSAIVTVLSLTSGNKNYGVMSAVLTVILAISIVYLNAQKYGARAQQFQMNHIALQKLGFEVKAASAAGDGKQLAQFQGEYIDLMQTSENHSHHDHLHTLQLKDKTKKRKQKEDEDEKKYVPRLCGYERVQFWAAEIGEMLFKGLLWILPAGYFVFTLVTHIAKG